MIVDMSSMILCSDYKDMDKKEEMEIRRLCSEVSVYLRGYSWCKKIDKVWFAGGFSKVAVFYVELLALGYENKLWVVNGDLPMAHLVTDDIPDGKEALLSYVCHMREWVGAVRGRRSTANCFPVDAVPSLKNANLLSDRLDFIEKYCAENF